MRVRPSSYALGHRGIAGEYSVTGWQAGYLSCLRTASRHVDEHARGALPWVTKRMSRETK